MWEPKSSAGRRSAGSKLQLEQFVTHIFGNIVQDVGLQWHVHINGPRDPAQFSLPHIQHPFNLFGWLAANYNTLERGRCYLLNGGLDLGQAEEVHVTELLLILSVLLQVKGSQGFVHRLVPLLHLICIAPECGN